MGAYACADPFCCVSHNADLRDALKVACTMTEGLSPDHHHWLIEAHA